MLGLGPVHQVFIFPLATLKLTHDLQRESPFSEADLVYSVILPFHQSCPLNHPSSNRDPE
jgi:hypothetical protein